MAFVTSHEKRAYHRCMFSLELLRAAFPRLTKFCLSVQQQNYWSWVV